MANDVTFATCTTTQGPSGCSALMQFAKRQALRRVVPYASRGGSGVGGYR